MKGKKITEESSNQFHYYQINYNISYVFFMAREESLLFFFALTYILFISHKGDNTLLYPPWLSSLKQQSFTLSSLAISSKAISICSLFLGYILEGGNPLLSPYWLLPSENPFFSLLVSCSIFPLLVGWTLRPKPSKLL